MTEPFRVGFLLFHGVTQLDFTGPLQVLSRLPNARVHLIATRIEPIRSDCGPFILPDTTTAACPDLDLLCIPGGFGVDDVIQDADLMAFVRRQAKCARYLTSVCTGAFVLGAAGILKGRRATTHWSYHDELALVGAIPTHARVVRDGDVFTGGGVTAGIDFAFTLVGEIAGREWAETLQLGLEYDPAPPYDAGAPEKAAPAVRAHNEKRLRARVDVFRGILDRVMAVG